MAEVMVGLWSVPHQGNWKLSPTERVFNMARALERLDKAAQAIQEPKPKPANWFRAIFLAPEYYFTRKSMAAVPDREPLSDDARMNLESQLLTLSRQYQGMLIVPGSMFYVKEMIRSGDPRAKYKFDPITGLRNKPKTSDADRRARLEHQIIDAADLANKRGAGFQVVKAGMVQLKGEHSARIPNPVMPFAPAQIVAKVPSLQEDFDALDAGKSPKIVRNAVWLLLDGGRRAKYDKHTDFFEAKSNNPDDMVFVPGTKDQCPVLGGFRFGIEICFDHANGVLFQRQTDPISFHLVVSDVVANSTGHMAMAEDGYFLHASTSRQQSCVYRRQGAPKDLTKSPLRVAQEQCAGGMLDIYRLPAPPTA